LVCRRPFDDGITLVTIIGLIVQLSTTIDIVLARNHLGATLLASTMLIVIAGYLIAGIGPAISSPSNGIWWA
jgi:voltage-gated potassium channel